MKSALYLGLATLLFLTGANAQTLSARNESTKQEIGLAFQRGLAFLKSRQNPETGAWGDAEPVAFTALAIASHLANPERKPTDALTPELEKAYAYLLKNVQPDGGIYIKARANYNTALALMALVLHPAPSQFDQQILAARRYLIGRQMDLDEKGKTDHPLDGGIGYGDDRGFHADLSNTHFTMEALKYAEAYLADRGDALRDEPKLNFAAAIKFIERCQNLPGSNDQPWVSNNEKERGGFIYGPTETRGPQEEPDANGRVAMRSYGSISYAGLLSFMYAGLTAEDPRVSAAIGWLSDNFTLDENPAMGAQGQYYYYHTMAKSLRAADLDELKLKDGGKVAWREALAGKLLNLQKGDGHWVNDGAGRWMESDPVLVTSYVLLALGHVSASW
jgi:squalene-hopene/tetraprenyl-beta-curcumene cyclase